MDGWSANESGTFFHPGVVKLEGAHAARPGVQAKRPTTLHMGHHIQEFFVLLCNLEAGMQK